MEFAVGLDVIYEKDIVAWTNLKSLTWRNKKMETFIVQEHYIVQRTDLRLEE